MRYSLCFTAIVAAAYAVALPAVSQIADGQIQQIADGQLQVPAGRPVQQISDGQIQAPKATSSKAAQQGASKATQAPKACLKRRAAEPVQGLQPTPVMQIADGQIQVPKATGSPVQQIGDGQVQVKPAPAASSAKPVQQIADGQVQKPASAGTKSSGSATSSSAAVYTPPSGYGTTTSSGAFKFPLTNGFPNIKVPSAELTAIEKQAHGTLPNGALPKKLSDASATTFQVIAFNEIFETAYFTSLLKNVTSGVYNPANKDYVIEAISAVQAQEELHALGANAILASAGRTPIQPCQYKFPVSTFESAIATASLFTDVVLGTLQEATSTFATTGDAGIVGLIASIVAQEGEQDGYYRTVGKKIPSALPFLSASSGVFAYSALHQLFVVPGTCGNQDAIKVPILQPLTVVTPPSAADSNITFTYPVDKSITSPANLRLVYINQQNAPIVQKLDNIKLSGSTVSFTAPFPYTANLLNGLTIAAVTNGPTTFANVSAVAQAAVWGPGLIEVN